MCALTRQHHKSYTFDSPVIMQEVSEYLDLIHVCMQKTFERGESRVCMGSVCVSTMNSHPTELQKERLTQHYGCGTPWVLFDWADSLS